MPHGITQCYSASEVTTLWRYTNLFIIIIIITCHPAEVTVPPLTQPKLVLDSVTLEGCKAELTYK